MSSKLYPPARPPLGAAAAAAAAAAANPLPPLLQTPAGLALVELQGTVNLPAGPDGEPLGGVEVGSLDFPDYVAGAEGAAWMRRVHLYVGQHQRLTGEVRKLPRAVAVVRRRDAPGPAREQGDELEVVEIVRYKLLFANRPEPVNTAGAA